MQVMAAALAVLGNCLQPPPALEAALPAAAPPSRPASPAAWLRTPTRQLPMVCQTPSEGSPCPFGS